MAIMQPLLITANLSAGFSSADRWSPALDGILAYYQLRQEMGVKEFNLSIAMNQQTAITDLPLQKVEHNDDWWWANSSPIFKTQKEISRKFYKKFNIDTALLIKRKVKNIELTKNTLKNYSLAFKQIITKKVQWHVIGNEQEIIKLLNQCQQIGAQRGKGMGYVESWEITTGDAKRAQFERPVPEQAAKHYNIQGIKAWRGYRPSVRLEENQGLCICPF